MSAHPQSPTPTTETKKYPRKLCKNCPKFFPQTKPTREFCSDECRKQFHRFGSSFGKLRETVEKMIRTESAAIVTKEFGKYVAGKDFKRAMAAAGFIHKSQLRPHPKTHRPKSLHAGLELLGGALQNMNQRLTALEASLNPMPLKRGIAEAISNSLSPSPMTEDERHRAGGYYCDGCSRVLLETRGGYCDNCKAGIENRRASAEKDNGQQA